MGMEKCVNSFNEATGLDLTPEESSNILQSMLRAKGRIEAQRGLAGREAMGQAASDLADAKSIAARDTKLRVLRDAVKRDTVMKEVQTNGGIKNAYETLRSIMHGSNKFVRDSIESQWHGLRDKWAATLNNELFKSGLKKVAESGTLDKDVSVAWWKLSNGENPGKGPAVEIAKLYSQVLDHIRDRQNASGANIQDAKNYVTTTEWDSVRMRQAAGAAKTATEGFEAWWAKDSPRMSEKTFDSVVPHPGQTMPEARKEFGRSLYDAFLTGVHMKVGEAETGYVHPDFGGTTNVADKISAHRAVVWKDGESWHEHMQDFGQSPTLHASVLNSINRGSRSLALLDKMGSNPGGQLNMLLRRIQETYRGDPDEVIKFQGKTARLQNTIGRLDGTLNIPANMGLAKFTTGVMQVEAMADLGGVGITHFASIWPTVTSEGAQHGINRLEMMGNMVKSLFTGLGDADRRNLMADLGAYSDAPYRHVSNALGDDTLPGKISSWAGKFMDATGLHFLFDRTKAGIRDMMAHNLGRNIDKSWEDLDPHLSQMLEKYRIGKDEWELIRGTDKLPTWGGRQYLTPSRAAEGIDAVKAEDFLRKNGTTLEGGDAAKSVAGLREQISDRLLSYYSDAARHGIVTPGVREQALLLGNTRPGTGWGTVARFGTQFKMWPVAAMNQILERDIYMSLSNKEAAWNIGKLIAIGVPAGYIRMSISDMARGHPLRDPRDPKTLLAAAAQSGGLGIMGDFLFGEVNRMGGGIISTLGGPVVSDADTLVRIFNRAKGDVEGEGHHRNGRFGDVWPDLARFGVQHIPFANLVYVKGALDYLMWYHLYESASPGWWERTNRRLQKEQGRAMTGYVPGGGVPIGVPGVYLGNNQGSSGIFGKGP